MSRRSRRSAAASLTLVALAAGCGGEDRERRDRLAGTYSFEETMEAGPGGQLVHERISLTLQPDQRWTGLTEATVDGAPFASVSVSGTYTFDGVTLVTNSREDGIRRYTVSGDTLWLRSADAHARTRAVTGVDMDYSETYLVRER